MPCRFTRMRVPCRKSPTKQRDESPLRPGQRAGNIALSPMPGYDCRQEATEVSSELKSRLGDYLLKWREQCDPKHAKPLPRFVALHV